MILIIYTVFAKKKTYIKRRFLKKISTKRDNIFNSILYYFILRTKINYASHVRPTKNNIITNSLLPNLT